MPNPPVPKNTKNNPFAGWNPWGVAGQMGPLIFSGRTGKNPGGPYGTPVFNPNAESGVGPGTIPDFPTSRRQPPPNIDPGTFQIGSGGVPLPQAPPMPPPNPDQERVITPEEAAQIPADRSAGRFDPDLINPGYPAPYDPGGWGGGNPPPPGTTVRPPGPATTGVRGYFNRLLSSPNVESMYTAGSILAGNPQPNESQLQQAVRAIGGAMSTRGAYAQMQREQAEAARKADLERRKVQVEEKDSATRQNEQWIKERQGDVAGDLEFRKQNEVERSAKVDEMIKNRDSIGLESLRKQEEKQSVAEIGKWQAEINLNNQKRNDELAKAQTEAERNRINDAFDRLDKVAKNKIEWARVRAYASQVEQMGGAGLYLKFWKQATDMAEQSESLQSIRWTSAQKQAFTQQMFDTLVQQSQGTGAAITPRPQTPNPAPGASAAPSGQIPPIGTKNTSKSGRPMTYVGVSPQYPSGWKFDK